MAPMPPDTDDSPPSGGINPGKTVVIRIAGILVVAVATMILLYGLVLALAFGGQSPLLSYLTSAFTLILLLVAAAGAGLVLHARKREQMYRQGMRNRRRNA